MRVLLTGANGFLGYYLIRQLLQMGYEVIATGKGDCRFPYRQEENFIYAAMDLTDPFSTHDVFEKHKPETVVHAGAMCKPDECEQHQWQAYTVNVEGTLSVLQNAAESKCFFIFISTDFIFDGEAVMYAEEDKPNPVNFYGKTKLEAEEAVKEYEFDWAIVRTVLVYGKPVSGRSNILSVVKEKLEKGESYKVVDDQVRTPTYVDDLVKGIIAIILKKATGIYHLSGKDILTPYQMACMTAEYLKLDRSLITRVTSENFTQPAKRPSKTIFDIAKAASELNYQPLSFEDGLRKTFS